jgi:hypothetical protein
VARLALAMPSPKKPKVTKTQPRVRDRTGALYVLLEPEMLTGIDGWVERLNTDNSGPKWTRTALIRALVVRGLKERAPSGEAP